MKRAEFVADIHTLGLLIFLDEKKFPVCKNNE